MAIKHVCTSTDDPSLCEAVSSVPSGDELDSLRSVDKTVDSPPLTKLSLEGRGGATSFYRATSGLYSSQSRASSRIQSQELRGADNAFADTVHPLPFRGADSSTERMSRELLAYQADESSVTYTRTAIVDGNTSDPATDRTNENGDTNRELRDKYTDSQFWNPGGCAPLAPYLGIFDSINSDNTKVSGNQSAFIKQLDLRITDYTINPRCLSSYVSYSLHFSDFGIPKVAIRRFSDFCYYDNILRELGYHPPISLPEKRFWDNLSPIFISQRFQALNNYFKMQLRHPTTLQLYLLQMFLGCSAESILYVHLVTARTITDKMNAVSLLYRFLMRSPADRDSFMSHSIGLPLTNFQHLPAATRSDSVNDESSVDYRLKNPLVVNSLLECLVSGDARTVYEACAILLWMLHRDESLRSSVLSLRAISYVTKAVSRLVANQGLPELYVSVDNLRDRTFMALLSCIPQGRSIAWNLVSYYLVMATNMLPIAARSFVDKDLLQKFTSLVDYKDHGVIRRFALWVLWIGMFEKEVRSSVDHDTLGKLMKKLYSSKDTTIKVLCGLVLTSLISSGWYDGDAAPRASVSVINLLPHVHGIDSFIEQEIFCHRSLNNLGTLVSDLSLPCGVRMFMVSLLLYHLVVGHEDRPAAPIISELCDMEFHGNTAELHHVLLGPADPDYRDDITLKDTCFTEKCSSVYLRQFAMVADKFSEPLYDIVEHYTSEYDSGLHDSDGETLEDSWPLCQTAAACLLFLPYIPSFASTGDYFEVDFNPHSMQAHYRNVVSLKGTSEKLQIESVNHINLGHTVPLCFDKQFFRRRITVLRSLIRSLQEHSIEFEDIHLSRNELAHESMELLRRFRCGKDILNYSENHDNSANSDDYYTESTDPFNNFTFEGFEYPMLEVPSFRRVDAIELRNYANELLRYGSAQQSLVRVLKLVILYHQMCSASISKYRSMVSCLQNRVDELCLDELDDLSALGDRYMRESRDYASGLEEENDVISTLQEKNAMLSRVQAMLRSSRMKLDACRRDIAATQKRIDDLPRLRNESVTAQHQLTLISEQLKASIQDANEKILELQDVVAREEREKGEYSLCIQRLTYLSSILEEGNYGAIIQALDTIPLNDVNATIHRHFDNISDSASAGSLDEGTVLQLKEIVLQQLTMVQDRLNAVYACDSNLQIAALNRQLSKDEENLYRTQLELNNARKSAIIDGSVLEETLGTQKVLMQSLEGTINNLTRELRQINAVNLDLDKQLSALRNRNNIARTQLESTRFEFKSSIIKQRDMRLQLFWQLLAAEFLCKKIWQEHRNLSTVLSYKASFIDMLLTRRSAEQSARQCVVDILKRASERISQTVAFLGDT
ncbi:kinesin-1 heavy chain-like, putative [Babesia ovis]|uniref:Kinesin-1 heavy chain-like, putative n=1 Tax=Babesia ovis TaxID=5869 RepID=A0A9W5WTF0_BABOV|nr:kinesin-1 heavy chain-like, putative [Babesia ovis]